MKKITSLKDLQETILILELKRTNDWLLLKEDIHFTYESLKPANIIRNSITEMLSGPGLKSNLINLALSFATGVVAKKIIVGKSHNPIIKLFGTVLEMVVANKVAKNADSIKAGLTSFVK